MKKPLHSNMHNTWLSQQDIEAATKARAWINSRIPVVFQSTEESLTVADVMAILDSDSTQPLEYRLFVGLREARTALYQKRYNMVMGALEAAERRGELDCGTTVNAKGMPDVRCFRKATTVAPLPTLTVVVSEGASLPAKVQEELNAWLAMGASLGIQSVIQESVSRGDSNVKEEPVRRRVARGTSQGAPSLPKTSQSVPKAWRVTHCKHGHAYTEDNTYLDKRGARSCKACRKAAWQRVAAKQQQQTSSGKSGSPISNS